MGGVVKAVTSVFKKPKMPSLPAAPSRPDASKAAAKSDLARRQKVSAGGRASTILAGKSIAEDKLKDKLGS